MSETTDPKLLADAEATAASSEAQPGSEESLQPENTHDSIPEKFVGKAPIDIIRSYNEIEKSFHKVSSERADERKAREALEAKVRELEARVTQPPQLHETQPTLKQPEVDPFAEYEQEFDRDPKEAIKSLVGKTREQALREAQLIRMAQEQQLAAEYYSTQKAENPEFSKLEPTMLELAKEYGDLVDPSKANSRKALKLLHLAAMGAKRADYAAELANKAKRETTTIREEKRAAFSESSASKGETQKSLKDMSVEEIERLYGMKRSL